MRFDELLSLTAKNIKAHGWKRAMLAVSGGVDSMCLADFFFRNRMELGLDEIAVAHVNHDLRGESSDLDEALVRRISSENGVQCFIERLDGLSLKESSGSLENNARQLRYAALNRFADEFRADVIVTAHHANDQAETVYMRLRRGVSIVGLRGIAMVNGRVFRPFLAVTRNDLVNYAKTNHLEWREDESNSDTEYTRNLIRHILMPDMERNSPGAIRKLNDIANLAQSAYQTIICLANAYFLPKVIPECEWPFDREVSPYEHVIAMHADNVSMDMLNSELFRIWLDSVGFHLAIVGNDLVLPGGKINMNKHVLTELTSGILWICDTGNCGCIHESSIYGHEYNGMKLSKWLHSRKVPKWVYPCIKVDLVENSVRQVHGINVKCCLQSRK